MYEGKKVELMAPLKNFKSLNAVIGKANWNKKVLSRILFELYN